PSIPSKLPTRPPSLTPSPVTAESTCCASTSSATCSSTAAVRNSSSRSSPSVRRRPRSRSRPTSPSAAGPRHSPTPGCARPSSTGLPSVAPSWGPAPTLIVWPRPPRSRRADRRSYARAVVSTQTYIPGVDPARVVSELPDKRCRTKPAKPAAATTPPALFAFTARHAPPHKVGRYVAIVSLGVTGSIAAGVPLGTWIGGVLGWRATFAAMATAGALVLVFVLSTLPRSEGIDGTPRLAEQFRILQRAPISLGLLANCLL